MSLFLMSVMPGSRPDFNGHIYKVFSAYNTPTTCAHCTMAMQYVVAYFEYVSKPFIFQYCTCRAMNPALYTNDPCGDQGPRETAGVRPSRQPSGSRLGVCAV